MPSTFRATGNSSCSPWGGRQAGARMAGVRAFSQAPLEKRAAGRGGQGEEASEEDTEMGPGASDPGDGLPGLCKAGWSKRQSRGQGSGRRVAGGPAGPSPFSGKLVFQAKNPPDPPLRVEMLPAARWSWRPAPPLSPSPRPSVPGAEPACLRGRVWFSAALGLQISSGLGGGSWNLTSQGCLRVPGTIWFL